MEDHTYNDKKIVFIPFGSYEQHGSLLPLNTDTLLAKHICYLLNEKIVNSLVLPEINYGMSKEHTELKNTISISMKSMIDYIMDILNSIANSMDIDIIVIINGHGGNQNTLRAICEQFNYDNEKTKSIAIHIFPENTRKLAQKLFGTFGAHADSSEASVLAVFYDSIVEGKYSNLELGGKLGIKGALKFYSSKKLSNNGIITYSDDIIIDKKYGELLINSIVDEIYNEIKNMISIIHSVENLHIGDSI